DLAAERERPTSVVFGVARPAQLEGALAQLTEAMALREPGAGLARERSCTLEQFDAELVVTLVALELAEDLERRALLSLASHPEEDLKALFAQRSRADDVSAIARAGRDAMQRAG